MTKFILLPVTILLIITLSSAEDAKKDVTTEQNTSKAPTETASDTSGSTSPASSTAAGSSPDSSSAASSSPDSSSAASSSPDSSSPASVASVSVSPINKTANVSDNEIDEIPDDKWTFENHVADTRRILYAKRSEKGKRPYMVYLQLTRTSPKNQRYPGWLCGGAVVDHYYVITSAACVEDADRFYVISGTTKYVESNNYKSDMCVCRRRRRVVWKCIPKNYKFDFQDSVRWSANDIAVIKVHRPFKFGVIEGGCEFAVCPIVYNNISRELEKSGTKGYIAGWGSTNTFREGVYRRQSKAPQNARCLLEAKVCIMDTQRCANKWAQRFREVIMQFMICTKDVMKRLSEECDKRYANCSDVETRRKVDPPPASEDRAIDLGRHLRDPNDYTARRSSLPGGFCENDHGGPLIIMYKKKEVLIGVISACKIDPRTHSCHGPFLYTSVFRNRQFISCAIHKDVETCRRVFRSGVTHEEFTVDWEGVDEDGNEKDPKAVSVVRAGAEIPIGNANDTEPTGTKEPGKADEGTSVTTAAPSGTSGSPESTTSDAKEETTSSDGSTNAPSTAKDK